MRYTALILALLILCCLQMAAHPPVALVVDDHNNVYFSAWGGTWKLDSNGVRSQFSLSDSHFMALDTVGRFATARLEDALRISPNGSKPVLFLFTKTPSTFHSDGDLYVAPWTIGRIRVERVKPDGSKKTFVDVEIDPRIARK